MKWALVFLLVTGCSCPSAKPERYRRVDVHTHFGPDAADRTMKLLADHGIDACVNLSGGFPGGGLEQQLESAARFPGRIFVFANLDWRIAAQREDFGAPMAEQLREAKSLGAKGLKISKMLGLGHRDRTGALIAVDDPRLDPIFDAAGALHLPVAIHVGDPIAFWKPVTKENERYDELSVHPGWSYAGQPVPSWEELFAALTRRIARHPKTTFISVHFGNAPELPERVAALLDAHSNLYVDTAARIPELGRHPSEKMRALFQKHRERILFGTDLGVGRDPAALMLGSPGRDPPTAADIEHFFNATWRYFETNDRQLAHPTPIQGGWKIDGIGLPKDVLKDIYSGNADRLLR
jgi:predicted TIM-barrel fold metal-dependent hydrolase